MYFTKMDDCDDDIVRNIDHSNDRVMVMMTTEVLIVLTVTNKDCDNGGEDVCDISDGHKNDDWWC
jgi:hypothetical protein